MCDKFDIKTNPNLVIALGEYIRNKRTKKSIGLREMADKLNISPAYLSNLELGKHNMTNPLLLKNIAKILEIDHLKLYKIIGYTDKDRLELRNEIWNEIIEDISDEKIIDIMQDLSKMTSSQLKLVKQYVKLIMKT
ncbi:helix-turn-helix domain-containing protein [Streptobacillus notomytis]|uniref:helix-turn-helix domain-containing protein n=1 Tax=Streptobacillus notomytis TaxID=1712031 RepID=UPI0009359002|nr:helix-turn-helix transcriptional regulator [Streptobacillus notomytis]